MKKYLAPICLLVLTFCLGGVRADSTLLSQALSNLHSKPVTYTEMLAFLLELQQHSPRVKISALGLSTQGRQIPAVLISSPDAPKDTWRFLFMARQHGNEPAGTDALLEFARFAAYCQSPQWLQILQRVRFILIPMVNPDGAVLNRRANARGVDLNRDWETLSQPETRAVENLVRAWLPHVLVDMHEVPPGNRYPEPFIECLRENHFTTYSYVREVRAEQAVVLQTLRLNGFKAADYSASDNLDESLSHRHFGLKYGIRSFLFESKRYADARGFLQERMRFHLTALLSLIIAVLNQSAGSNQQALQPVQTAPALPPPTTPGRGLPPLQQPTAPAKTAATKQTATVFSFFVSGLSPAEKVTLPLRLGYRVSPGLQSGQYLELKLDETTLKLTNLALGEVRLGREDLQPGKHVLALAVVDRHGFVLGQRSIAFTVSAEGESSG